MSRIDFSRDTLGELLGVAIGIGMDRKEVERMSRARLEATIQAHHSAECRREAYEATKRRKAA